MSRVDLKVVLLGQKNGGKTCLVERFLNDRFQDVPYQNTIGAAFGAKKTEVNGKRLTMGIWDTAGGERYEAMSRIYYRGAKGAVVCYDILDNSSFERAKFWVAEIRKNEENCKIYLCGTKKDLIDGEPSMRQVSLGQIHRFAGDINAEVFETSSKTGENVKELFTKIAEDYSAEINAQLKSEDNSIRLNNNDKKIACCT